MSHNSYKLNPPVTLQESQAFRARRDAKGRIIGVSVVNSAFVGPDIVRGRTGVTYTEIGFSKPGDTRLVAVRKDKLKKFEVKIQYTGTLTYVVKAASEEEALEKGQRHYDNGVEPTNLMTDWEHIKSIKATPL